MAYLRKVSGLNHFTVSDLALHSKPVSKNGVRKEKSRKLFINIPNLIISQRIWNIALNIFSNTDDDV
jgi:hypothetical protein